MKFKQSLCGKLMVIVAVMCLSSLMLAGCGSSTKVNLDKDNPVSVEIWHYYNDEQKVAFDELVREFNDTVGQEEGIIVEALNHGNVNELTSSVLDSVDGKVGSDQMPNIVAAYADTAYQVDKRGLAVNLDQYFSKKELAGFVPSYVEEGRLGADGGLKILPTAKSVEVLMLNKTDWDKFANATGASIDQLSTIEGVTKVSGQYYDWTDSQTPSVANDGKALFGRDAMANYFIIGCKQLGVDIFAVNDGEVTFNLDKEVMKRLWDNYYVPYVNGYFVNNGRFRSDDAKIGDLIALVGSTTSATFFPKQVIIDDGDSYDIESLVMPAPCFEGGEDYAVQQGAGMVVLKSTPEQDYASAEFLKWFTQNEQNIKFSLMSSYLPVKAEANDMKLLEESINADEAITVDGIMKQTLEAGVETVSTEKLYTNKAFEGGTDARKVLEYSMLDKAQADREAFKKALATGITRAEAIEQFDNQANYEAWLQSLKAALEATKN